MDVRQAFIEYACYNRRFRPATITAYLQAWDQFIHYLEDDGKPLLLESVNVRTVQGFKMAMFKRGLADSSVGNRLFGLREVLRFCQSEGLIENNPAVLVDAPPRRQRLPVYLKQDEARRFLETPVKPYRMQRFGHDMAAVNAYLAARDAVAFRVLAFCGLRIGELVALDLADLDLEAATLTVRNGKGGRDRIIPLLGGLRRDLTGYLPLRQGMGDDLALFVSWNGKRWPVKNARAAFNRHLRHCGFDGRKVTPHTLRHTFATMLVRRGVQLPSLQRLLGHADVRSTMVYIHVELDDLRRAVELHPLAGESYPNMGG